MAVTWLFLFLVPLFLTLLPASLLHAEVNGEVEEQDNRIRELEEQYMADKKAFEERIDFLEEELFESLDVKPPPSTIKPNLFNPQMTAFGDFLARADDQPVKNDAGEAIDDRFNLREVELDLRSSIDPWADGVVIAAFDSETPGQYEALIEEGYVTIKKLPLLNSAPWGLKLRAGRFRPAFGRFNQIHQHDLPQVDYPLPLRFFLGEEGLVQNGVSGRFFLPLPWDRTVVEADMSVLNGGGLPVGNGTRADNLAFLGHVKWFTDLMAGHDIEFGASSYLGRTSAAGEPDSRLYGLDFTYKWKPSVGGEWRSFLLGGEFFLLDAGNMAGSNGDPLGYYAWSQVQLNRQIYLGGRYGRVNHVDESVESRSVSAYATYYTTEFLRFRGGYQHTTSDRDTMGGLDTVFLEINFVYGSHPVEPYWVNR